MIARLLFNLKVACLKAGDDTPGGRGTFVTRFWPRRTADANAPLAYA